MKRKKKKISKIFYVSVHANKTKEKYITFIPCNRHNFQGNETN